MLEMWDVQDVECLGCEMWEEGYLHEMQDVGLQNAS